MGNGVYMAVVSTTNPEALQQTLTCLLRQHDIHRDMTMRELAQSGARLAHADPSLADWVLHEIMPYITHHVIRAEDGSLWTEVSFPYVFSRTLTLIFCYPGVTYLDGALYTEILISLASVSLEDLDEED